MVRKLTKNFFFYFYSLLFTFYSFAALAQSGPTEPPEDFRGFVSIVMDLISLALPVVIGLSLVAFFSGLAVFILHADNEEKRREGKIFMIWGIIGLFVMISVWGIINILTESFGFDFIFPQLKTS